MKRSDDGYSLVMVASLGLIMIMMALAVTAALIPVYKNIGNQNLITQAQAAAEVGIQYALQQLNSGADPSTTPLTVPPSYLGPNTSVQVTIEPVDASKLPSQYSESNIGFPVDTRRLTSQAVCGLTKATVICGIQKVNGTRFNTPLTQEQIDSMPNKQSLFSNALFGASSLSIDNRTALGQSLPASRTLQVLSDNSTRQAQIGSNQSVSFYGNTVVDGNVVANNPTGSATSILGSNTNRINGNLTFNGNMTTTNGNPSFLADTLSNLATYGVSKLNVLGDGQLGPFPQSGSINSQLAQSNYASAPTSAPGSVSLGNVVVASGETATLPAGNYTVNSLTVQSGGKLVITPVNNPGSNNPDYAGAVINVVGSDSATPVSISGTVQNNLGAQNLQIFYNGTKNISLNSSSNLSGLVYAPNASVSLVLSGQQFKGAISANTLNVQGYGTVKYDPASTGAGAGPTPNKIDNTTNTLFYSPNKPQGVNYYQYRILTWYEP